MTEETSQLRATVTRIGENWPGISAGHASIVMATQRLARILQRIAQTALRPFGLTPAEFELLAALRSCPPPHRLTPSDLYDAMMFSSGGMTKVLKGLEARGLLLRPRAEGDGRSRPVQLSREGVALAETAMEAVQAAESHVMQRMAERHRGPESLPEALLGLAIAAEDADAPGG